VYEVSNKINTAQVYAVPSVLIMLEIMSIALAKEIFSLTKSTEKSIAPVVLLFFACQSYPWISVVYQIADTQRVAVSQSNINSSTNEKERAKTFGDQLKAKHDEMNSLREEQRSLTKQNKWGGKKAEIEAKKTEIDTLSTEIKNLEKEQNTILKTDSDTSKSTKTSTPIEFWLADPFSRGMNMAYFLASLFPIILLSLGYYKARIL
jgi:hypothetical protein